MTGLHQKALAIFRPVNFADVVAPTSFAAAQERRPVWSNREVGRMGALATV